MMKTNEIISEADAVFSRLTPENQAVLLDAAKALLSGERLRKAGDPAAEKNRAAESRRARSHKP